MTGLAIVAADAVATGGFSSRPTMPGEPGRVNPNPGLAAAVPRDHRYSPINADSLLRTSSRIAAGTLPAGLIGRAKVSMLCT